MEIIVRRRDIYVCAILILGFSSFSAWALYDTNNMKKELDKLAEFHLYDYFDRPNGDWDKSEFDYLAIVDSGKAFVLFGRSYGVVHTYYKRKGDTDFKTFEGIEYFYNWEHGEWKLMDSAGCGAVEHHIRAFDTFIQQNVDVPNRIFNKALGIDFLDDHDHSQHMHDHDNHKHALGDHAHVHEETDAPDKKNRTLPSIEPVPATDNTEDLEAAGKPAPGRRKTLEELAHPDPEREKAKHELRQRLISQE